MARPSACPASFLVAVPITLPMSCAACAHFGNDFLQCGFQLFGTHLLGQIRFQHCYLGQFAFRQVGTA